MSTTTTTPLLQVTDTARAMVLSARAGEPDADRLALWLEVTGVSGSSFTYDLFFQAASDAGPGDAVEGHGDLVVVVPAASVDQLRGASLDVAGEGDDTGLVVRNPNSPPPPAGLPEGIEADLSSDLAQRVLAVLDQQVNPSIAAHGGRADLAGVHEATAYVVLSGGCQGCGMSRMTLRQGIEVSIVEAVPEITSVVDVTDHAGGANPYYQA